MKPGRHGVLRQKRAATAAAAGCSEVPRPRLASSCLVSATRHVSVDVNRGGSVSLDRAVAISELPRVSATSALLVQGVVCVCVCVCNVFPTQDQSGFRSATVSQQQQRPYHNWKLMQPRKHACCPQNWQLTRSKL